MGTAEIGADKIQAAILCAVSPVIAAVTFLFLLSSVEILTLLLPFALIAPLAGAALIALEIVYITVFIIIISVFVEFFIKVCLFGESIKNTSFWEISETLGTPLRDLSAALSRGCP